MQKLCHWWVGIRMMLTGCRGKKSGGSRELDFLFPPAAKQMFFTTSFLWWVWLHMASCPPPSSSTGEGAGFDVCRDTGRKSISVLCVLERKPMIFFSQPARCTCSTSALLCMLQALMSLFVLASKDGWVNIMYNGLDAVAVDQQVQRLPCERTFLLSWG